MNYFDKPMEVRQYEIDNDIVSFITDTDWQNKKQKMTMTHRDGTAKTFEWDFDGASIYSQLKSTTHD